MMRLRTLALVLVVAALALSVGTGAFSATTAERGVQVSVVPDSQAFLSIDEHHPELDNGMTGNGGNSGNDNTGTTGTAGTSGSGASTGGSAGQTKRVTLLTLENKFGHELTNVAVDLTGDMSSTPPEAKDVEAPEPLGLGGTGEVTAKVVCSGADENTETWTVDIEAWTDDTVHVETSERVTVECTGEPPSSSNDS